MRLVFPDPERMTEIGHRKLSHVPFLVGNDGHYEIAANRYIRERANAEWRPATDPDAQNGYYRSRHQFLTKQSCEALARRLMEFLLWCKSTVPHIDWRQVQYTEDLVLRWQVGMLDGSASRKSLKLSPATVNARIGEAINFLKWAAERGYRATIQIPQNVRLLRPNASSITRGTSDGNLYKRIGSMPVPPQRIDLPSDDALAKWLIQLQARHGIVMRLMAETMMRTGMRISECNQLRVTDIPEKHTQRTNDWPTDWRRAGSVPVLLVMGNKGQKTSPGSLETTRPRTVYLPLDLADRIVHYINEGRPTLIARGIATTKDRDLRQKRIHAPRPLRLWVGKYGREHSNSWIRQCWRNVPTCPPNWSPHKARSLFAIETIATYMNEMLAHANQPRLPHVGWLHGMMAGQIRIILSPLMGHISEETTMIYLIAARKRILDQFDFPSIRWLRICENHDRDCL